jgi:outer membrane receptor protein involved in Fe transport
LIDDIDFSGPGTAGTLYDIDQIDVLRGPQPTRYGANALAGLIYLRSAEPTDTLYGRVDLDRRVDS